MSIFNIVIIILFLAIIVTVAAVMDKEDMEN